MRRIGRYRLRLQLQLQLQHNKRHLLHRGTFADNHIIHYVGISCALLLEITKKV